MRRSSNCIKHHTSAGATECHIVVQGFTLGSKTSSHAYKPRNEMYQAEDLLWRLRGQGKQWQICRVSGPPSEDNIVFDLELPAAPMSERAATFLEAINKQTQIDQVRSRLLVD